MNLKTTITIATVFMFGTLNGQYIDGGNQHTVILTKDSSVWTMGKNEYGELGDSSFTRRILPVRVKGIPKIINVSRGYKHTLAVDKNNEVWSWGWNNYGQLAAEEPKDYCYPQKVEALNDIIAVEGGHWHSLALTKEGDVWSWGHNFYGELGNGNREHSEIPQKVKGIKQPIIQIASVGYFSLGLDENGRVWSWGDNNYGQLGDGTTKLATTAKQVKGIGNYVRMNKPTKTLLDIDGDFQISPDQKEKLHPEAMAELGLNVEKETKPSHENAILTFVKYNKKFMVSLMLNLYFLFVLLKLKNNKKRSI
jgi:alpha-tubulin suppressor-like RCC1 family protein